MHENNTTVCRRSMGCAIVQNQIGNALQSHGLKKRSKVDSAKVQRYSEWLIPNIEKVYRYIKQTYTNISVLSSMMLPVVSVLRKVFGLHDQITDMWGQEATDLRIQATQEASRNVQGKDSKTYQEICRRRDDIKRRIDGGPANTTEYWKWFALCLYTMQPPFRADWAGLSIVDSVEKASSGQNSCAHIGYGTHSDSARQGVPEKGRSTDSRQSWPPHCAVGLYPHISSIRGRSIQFQRIYNRTTSII